MTTHTKPKIGRLTHQWGSTTMPLIDPDTGIVTTLLVERDGERRNAYVTELRPNIDTIFLEGAGVAQEQVSSGYILSLLKSENPGYQRHRIAFFVEQGFLDDRTTYETTRLRADLYSAVAAQRPDLFKPEELDNLTGYIFRKHMADRPAEISPEDADKWRLDFSQETVRHVASYIREKSVETGAWRYSGLAPVYRWLGGETIHPTHNTRKSEQIKDVPIADLAEDVVVMSNTLGAYDLAERAAEVADTERRAMGDEYARRGSPYFEIIDAHRSAVHDMRGIMRETGDGKPADKTRKTKKGRVHDEMPEWKARVLEKLEPLLKNKVVGSRFYSFDLVEMSERGEGTEKPGHGLPIRILTTTSEERAKRTYDSTGIRQAPSRRPDSLRTSLLRSYEILGEIYRAAVPLYIQDLEVDSRGQITLLPRHVADSLCQVTTGGSRVMACINLDEMRFLSPEFGYSHPQLIDLWSKWISVQAKAKKDRPYRRNLMRTLNQHLPDEHPASDILNQVYSNSPLLRRLYETERSFARDFTTAMRQVDSYELSVVVDAPAPAFALAQRYTNEKHRVMSEVFSDLEGACAELIEELKQSDLKIPRDVTMFRMSPRSVSTKLDTVDTSATERSLFRRILSAYGLDPSDIISEYDNVVLKSAQATHDRVKDLKEKHNIVGKFVFGMISMRSRTPSMIEL